MADKISSCHKNTSPATLLSRYTLLVLGAIGCILYIYYIFIYVRCLNVRLEPLKITHVNHLPHCDAQCGFSEDGFTWRNIPTRTVGFYVQTGKKQNAACKHLISYISFGFRCVEYSFSQTDECCVVAFLSC